VRQEERERWRREAVDADAYLEEQDDGAGGAPDEAAPDVVAEEGEHRGAGDADREVGSDGGAEL
jgi:hypothetical protein